MNIVNLRKLREVGQGVLDRRDGDLGFGQWDCGTFACLLGHYCRETDYELTSDDPNLIFISAAEHFNISPNQTKGLFQSAGAAERVDGIPVWPVMADHPGPEAYTVLEGRLGYLDKLISKAEDKARVQLQTICAAALMVINKARRVR